MPTILVLSTVLQAVQADSISVLPSCPGVGDPFQVTFSKDLDQNFDDNWIAIFADGTFENSQGLPEGAMWVSLCGTQTCDTTTNPSEGTVRFRGNGQAWLQSWPLQAGSYRAVLTRGEDGEIWPALAVSDVFEVGCDSAPAPAPTDSVPAPSLGSEMISIINDAISDIEDLIASNQLLIGKFLRLAFHDCVGGCDGELHVIDGMQFFI